MALTEKRESNALYLSIVQGIMRQKVDEGTSGAIKRDYETKDGNTGSKWEIHHKNLTGFIEAIDFRESDFGDQCTVRITDGKDAAVLNISLESRYFIDFAQKLSNIDFNEKVTLNPFDFINKESGKPIKGITVIQYGAKVENYFWDKDNKCSVNGMIKPDNGGEGFDTDDWKMYFIKLKKFLKQHVEKQLHGIGNFEVKDQGCNQEIRPNDNFENSTREIPPLNVDDIPPEKEEDDLPF